MKRFLLKLVRQRMEEKEDSHERQERKRERFKDFSAHSPKSVGINEIVNCISRSELDALLDLLSCKIRIILLELKLRNRFQLEKLSV